MASTSARVEVYTDRRGKIRWQVRARNDRVQAVSGQAYSSKSNTKRGIARAIKAIANPGSLIEAVKKKTGYIWELRDRSGKIQATASEIFISKSKSKRAARSAVNALCDPELLYLDVDKGWSDKPLLSENI